MSKCRAIRSFFRLPEINGNRVSEEVSNETCVFPIVPVREFKILNCEIGKPESGSSPDTCVALYRGPYALRDPPPPYAMRGYEKRVTSVYLNSLTKCTVFLVIK